ncbi:BON domain-containing protein [Burkholderia sp. 22PA0099]|uniref:BON domain-containing protein n=1 Tax=Burkholderia sp. 22PA0099 TaxID=3237372 RepID=UPI0039C35B97
MKSIVWKALGSAVVAALVCGNVYAQASDAASTDAPAATKSTSKAGAKTARKQNRQLGYAVRKAITKAGGVDVSNITVRSKGGAISLQGSVPDASQIDKAGDAAKGVKGVTSVDNKLTVQQQ